MILQNTTTKVQILNTFEFLKNRFLGDDPELPAYYTKDDIPQILQLYKQRRDTNFTIKGVDCNQRWKSLESLEEKLNRHINNGLETFYTCNDWFGVCLLVDSYTEVPFAELQDKYKVQLTHQDHNGYYAIHAYLYHDYQVPIEVQFHTKFDHIFNTWNRIHNYKKIDRYGYELRSLYDSGKLQTEDDYITALQNFIDADTTNDRKV